MTVRDLFYGTVLPSGGDAALGLAIYTAGAQEAFVPAKHIIPLPAHICYRSPHGHKYTASRWSNPQSRRYNDMAVIMKAAMQNELCREVLSAHTYTTKATAEHPEGITM